MCPTMKFPITRESLQAFDPVEDRKEVLEEQTQARLNVMVDGLCKSFQHNMPSNVKAKRYVWQCQSFPFERVYFPQFIEKLKAIFIGCDVIVDPLQTYIIIDWS
jgi:hypothetical protein